MHLLDQLGRPVVIAHRGASSSAPENTIAAFREAVDLGAHAIELDTMLSADGIPVVIHDHTLDRTTTGSGLVSRLPLQELTRLDAGSWFSESFSGEKIPSLQFVLDEFSDQLMINIELKNYHSPKDNLPETVIKMVHRKKKWDSILFSSFLPGNIRKVKAANPGAKVALLCAEGLSGWFTRSAFYRHLSPEIIHPAAVDASQEYIKRQHQKGRRVHAWTVNNPMLAEKLFRSQIDGIFTDDPASMMTLIDIISL